MDGILFICTFCGARVFICRSCWRGQKYCPLTCQIEVRKAQQRARQARYSASEIGKINQNSRSRRRRLKKNATDATTNPKSITVKPSLPRRTECCAVCGVKLRLDRVVSPIDRTFSLRRIHFDQHRNPSGHIDTLIYRETKRSPNRKGPRA